MGEKVKSITDVQITKYKRLIDVTNDTDPEKPDLLFRLAELYNEQYRYYDFRSRELDEKIFDAGNAGNAGLANQLKGQQADYLRKSQQWLLASAKEYLEVADHPDKYGSYKRMDEVLFYLAYMLNQVKKEDAARKYFKRLIKDYPEVEVHPLRVPRVRRLLLRPEAARGLPQVLRQGHAVPRVADLRLREIQRGLGLLQPR